MEWLEAFWLIVVCLLSFLAYISFSLIARDIVSTLTACLEPVEYKLPPLSNLSPDPEGMAAIVSFSRLLFVIPILLIVQHSTEPFGAVVAGVSLAGIILLLYLLPEWMYGRVSIPFFKGVTQVFSYVFYPLFWLLAKLMPRIRKVRQTVEETKTEAEETEVESEEFKGDLLRAISTIGDTTVKEVMTPRVDMVAVSSSATLNELHQMFKEHKFSRLPVFKEKVDNIVGIVSVMDLVSVMPKYDSITPVTSIIRPAMFVPETKKVFTLLREFRESHSQMAIVIDEYGGTSGLVTLEDLLEEIVGEIGDEHDEVPLEYYREKDGTIIVTGKFPIEKFEEIFEVEVPEEDFETVSGLIFSVLGRIPMVGEVVQYKNLKLEILEADKRRIHRVRIQELPKEQEVDAI
ncbi:MAG TPA: hemolysin family protein [Acidobacteriota bacterium]|nr:hemolysin family protein [Acidobacteriota bacterium]